MNWIRTKVVAGFAMAVLLSTGSLFAQDTESKHDSNEIKVISIKNVDAEKMNELVQVVFESPTDHESPTDQVGKSVPTNQLIPTMATSLDPRTNSLIIMGRQGDLQVVESLVKELDQATTRPVTTTVYELKNAPAIDVAQAIHQWLADRNKLEDQASKAEFAIVREVVSNKIIATTSLDEAATKELDEVVRALDQRPDSIQIEMVIKQTVDGETKVVGSPNIVTLDSMRGTVTLGTELDSITVELTPRINRLDSSPGQVIRIGSESIKANDKDKR